MRTNAGESSFHFSTSPGPAKGFFGLVFASQQNGTITSVEPGGQITYGHSMDPGLYTPNGSYTSCSAGQCNTFTIFGGSYNLDRVDDSSSAINTAFVTLEGGTDYSFDANGWTIKPLPFTDRYLDAGDQGSTAYYVSSGGGGGAEVFLDATAPGPASGSIAQAEVPCSNDSMPGPGHGVSRITLDGGLAPPTATCPATYSAVADFAKTATTWNSHGIAVGDRTLEEARLWVVDLPTADGWWRPDPAG